MRNDRTAVVLVLILAVCIFGTGFFWFLTHLPTGDLLAVNQETARLNAEVKRLEAQEALLQSQVAAKIRLQSLENQRAAENTALYRCSLAAAKSVQALWFVWVLLSGIGIVAHQRFRFEPQVEFEAEGIKTMIPAKKAVDLTRDALKVAELKHSAQILALDDDRAGRRLRENVQALKALKNIVPKEPPMDIIDATPELAALPAFSGNVYYSQLLLDQAYEPGLIPYGRDVQTGGLIQIGVKPLQSCVKVGKQGFGKTEALKPEILTGLDLKYVLKQPVRMHLIDPHGGLENSLATEIKPVLPLFDTLLLGNKILKSDDILAFLDSQIQDAERRQAREVQPSDPWDLIWIDEYTQTIATHERGKEIDRKVKELLNLRKARKFLSFAVYDSSKGDNSGKGLSVQKMGCSVLCFNTSAEQAAAVLGWSEAAKLAPTLKEGQALLKLPKSKGFDGEIVQCQCGFVTLSDFTKYLAFVPATNAQDAPGRDERDQEVEEDARSADAIKTRMEEQEWSLNAVAKMTGIPKSTLSNFFNQKGRLTEEQFSKLEDVLTQKNRNVISFEKAKTTLQKQA